MTRPDPDPDSRPTAAQRPSRGWGAFVLLLAAALVADVSACVARVPAPGPPPASAAIRAFAEARALARTGAEDERIDEAVRRAVDAAPDWAAPARFLDDRGRATLAGAEVLARRLGDLAESPDDPTALYLVGRLEGRAGSRRFQAAARAAPDHAWAQHGIAWTLFNAGRTDAAWQAEERALALARTDWDRSQFLAAIARYASDAARPVEALALFDAHAPARDGSALGEAELLDLEAWRVVLELLPEGDADVAEGDRAERGLTRGLELLRVAVLPPEALVRVGDALALHAARAQRPSLVEELRARLSERGDALAVQELVGLERRTVGSRAAARMARDLAATFGGPVLAPAVTFEDLLRRGEFEAAARRWLEDWPVFLLDGDGLPREARHRRVVEAARAADPRALGDALIAAGSFDAAVALSEGLRARDGRAALDLEARARSGRALLDALGEVFEDVDAERTRGAPHYPALDSLGGVRSADEIDRDRPGRKLGDLDAVLDGLAAPVARFGGHELAEALRTSPRQTFGPFATLIHPGPTYSDADARAGHGEAGESVSGLAALMRTLGRFAIVGNVRGGGGPDGTILRLLALEEIEGAHLGVPYQGLVAWCDGQDLPSRPGRRGARITGAALHEGYWIDVAPVRLAASRWLALQARWLGPEAPRDPAAVVALRGPLVSDTDGQRRDPLPGADAGDRIRLAVLLDRTEQRRSNGSAPSTESLVEPLVGLEELLRCVAWHEEGHLCDRTRFLPLSQNLWRVLGFVARQGFSPARIARQVEYRAQLTALCVADEPRILLAEVAEAVDGGPGITPHAAAYSDLLADLLRRLDRDLDAYPALDPAGFLHPQLPRLGPEEVRRLALAVARDNGMVEE